MTSGLPDGQNAAEVTGSYSLSPRELEMRPGEANQKKKNGDGSRC
jgi:hypothetical protein